MAMSKASLVQRMKTAFGAPASAEGVAIQDDVLGKIAEAIIDEIKINGVVTVASGIAVSTTGTASAQTGATTATGTGTIA